MPLNQLDVERVIRKLISGGGEYADLFFEEKTGTSIVYENGKVDRIRRGIDRGVGLRVIRSLATFYAFSTEVTAAALDELVRTLTEAVPSLPESAGLVFGAAQKLKPSVFEIDPAAVDLGTKIALLAEADEAARSFGGEINQVRVTISDEQRRVVQVNSDRAHLEFR
ncbi:MAG: DNA gyrase modulator [Desulfomonilaceae bacterium]